MTKRRTKRRVKSRVKSRVPKRTKRRSKKNPKGGKKKKSAWNIHMMQVYKSMKKNDPSVKLGDAMKAAGKTFKKL